MYSLFFTLTINISFITLFRLPLPLSRVLDYALVMLGRDHRELRLVHAQLGDVLLCGELVVILVGMMLLVWERSFIR